MVVVVVVVEVAVVAGIVCGLFRKLVGFDDDIDGIVDVVCFFDDD